MTGIAHDGDRHSRITRSTDRPEGSIVQWMEGVVDGDFRIYGIVTVVATTHTCI